jgi:hypothetical protein
MMTNGMPKLRLNLQLMLSEVNPNHSPIILECPPENLPKRRLTFKSATIVITGKTPRVKTSLKSLKVVVTAAPQT